MKKVGFLFILVASASFVGCGVTNGVDYKETESGLKYAFHVETGQEKPQPGDILSLEMVYHLNDSTLFDSRETGLPMFLEMMEPEFPGDIYEGLAMMSVGDSASFVQDAEQFFLLTAGMMEVPPFLEPGDQITFDVSLLKAMDDEGFAQEQQRIMEQQMEDDMRRAEQEEGLMLEYLEDEDITVHPTESGLYYVEKARGEGAKVEPGDRVAVHYEGRLLDGTVFDSSYEREEPLEFVIGQGQVITGWDEGIGMMHVGGVATLVIPSHLAYGERGAGQMIPPFSTLVFDVEVVDIID